MLPYMKTRILLVLVTASLCLTGFGTPTTLRLEYRDTVTNSANPNNFSEFVSNRHYSVRYRAYNDGPAPAVTNALALIRYPKDVFRFVSGFGCAELEPFAPTDVGEVMCNFARINSRKTRELTFVAQDTDDCDRWVALGNFTLTGANTQAVAAIGPEVYVACPEDAEPPPFGDEASFALSDTSSIHEVDPAGGAAVGDQGRWGGELNYEVAITNPFSQPLTIDEIELSRGGDGSLAPSSMIDRTTFGSTPSLGCSATRYRVECDFGTIAPGATVKKNFALAIRSPNPFADRSPFDPLAVCANKQVVLKDVAANTAEVEQLQGVEWDDTEGHYVIPLDHSTLTGLDCDSQTFTP